MFVVTDVVTALFPTACLLCAGPMLELRRERVCDACLHAVARQTESLCTRCGEALGMESARFAAALGATECTQCRLAPPAFTRAVAHTAYEESVRQMVHLLKFGGHRRLAGRVLGGWLAQAIAHAIEGREAEFLVLPVPLFRARERSRGFNQAELLARAALAQLRRERPDLRLQLAPGVLERVRDTRPQFALDPRQRRRNLQGAFKVLDQQLVRGREVVLVDDIMTTGATARECARVLVRAGAANVVVATVARAQPESLRGLQKEQEGLDAVARWNMRGWDVPNPSAEIVQRNT